MTKNVPEKIMLLIWLHCNNGASYAVHVIGHVPNSMDRPRGRGSRTQPTNLLHLAGSTWP